MSWNKEEMLENYSNIISKIEDILRGIPEDLFEIKETDYADYKEYEYALLIRRRYLLKNEKEEGVELLFPSMEIAKKRVREAIEYIKQQDVDFATIELICYASFYLIYFSMRDCDVFGVEEIDEISQIIKSELLNTLKVDDNKEQYLEKIYDMVCLNIDYIDKCIDISGLGGMAALKRDEINGVENKYKDDFHKILNEAYEKNPKGELVEIFREIQMIEDFFQNDSEKNLKKLNLNCFSKKDNWLGHIFTCCSLDEGEIAWREMRYLPHIEFHTSSKENSIIWKCIRNRRPLTNKGSVNGNKRSNDTDEELNQKLEKWEKAIYQKVFGLPHEVSVKESQGTLIYNILSLLMMNKELEITKNDIVSDFTHRYKNYEIDTVYQIANALSSNPSQEELKDLSRELLLEYSNKQMLSREIAMLSLEHRDSFEELRTTIKKSITTVKKGITIENILNEALKRVLLRILLVADEDRMEDIRQKYESKGIDTWELLDKYEIDILKENVNSVKWVNQYMNSLIIEISDEWKNVYFKEYSDGGVFLMSLLMELILNMFTYTDISDDMYLKFSVNTISTGNYFVIETKNKVDYDISSNGKKGLSSRNKILSKINYGQDYKWHDSILKEYSEDKMECVVIARICSELLGGNE